MQSVHETSFRKSVSLQCDWTDRPFERSDPKEGWRVPAAASSWRPAGQRCHGEASKNGLQSHTVPRLGAHKPCLNPEWWLGVCSVGEFSFCSFICIFLNSKTNLNVKKLLSWQTVTIFSVYIVLGASTLLTNARNADTKYSFTAPWSSWKRYLWFHICWSVSYG